MELHARSLNRSSIVPLYYQLAEDLRSQLAADGSSPGQALPSEAELGQAYGVARSVVRQALDELQRSGLITRIKGKGAFAAERKLLAYLMQDAVGFYANMQQQGIALESQVLFAGAMPAPSQVAAALRLPAGARVYAVERLRSAVGEALFYGTTYLPWELGEHIAREDLTQQSLNALLAKITGRLSTGGERTIEAVTAGRREAELLRMPVGGPLFRLFAATQDQDGLPLECSLVYLRGDRVAFRTDLGCRPDRDADKECPQPWRDGSSI